MTRIHAQSTKGKKKHTMGSRDPLAHLLSAGLIDDPQWVSYCVEHACRFSSEAAGYVCRDHCSRHVCSTAGCSLLRNMVDWTKRATAPPSECPVEQLLVFRKLQVEFRSSYYIPYRDHGAECGYGGVECDSGLNAVSPRDPDANQIILTASVPVTVALFATILTPQFHEEYQRVHHDTGSSITTTGASRSSWMAATLSLAREVAFTSEFSLTCSREALGVVRDAAMRNAAALSTLFDCKDGNINRFMRKMACKYNEKHVHRTGFNAMVIMVSLCLFPYLKHRVLGDMFDNRTVVIMFFDKAITKHNQWSSLSTHIHLHANDVSFVKRVLTDSGKRNTLPSVITATLDTYIRNAVLGNEMHDSVLGTQREDLNEFTDAKKRRASAPGHAAERKAERKAATVSSRKRKGSCYGKYYKR